VNCSACHQVTQHDSDRAVWVDKPGHRSCASCHNPEVERFKRGKHGMRLAVDLPPMTAGEARLPMQAWLSAYRWTVDRCLHRLLTSFK